MALTTHEMIVNHPGRLHERMANRGADKLEAPPQKVTTQF
jgi:hypothetical protein